jgi:hypothetical protein
MAVMLRCGIPAENFRRVPQSRASNESSRHKAGCVTHDKSERSIAAGEAYPPHAKGDDARSITFIMRLPFGIDILVGWLIRGDCIAPVTRLAGRDPSPAMATVAVPISSAAASAIVVLVICELLDLKASARPQSSHPPRQYYQP